MVKKANKRKKKSSKVTYRTTKFHHFDNHGINSHKFIINNNSNHNSSSLMLAHFEDFCINTLRQINTHNSMNICIESPKCCKGYARPNIDRGVPIRQYFGKVFKHG